MMEYVMARCQKTLAFVIVGQRHAAQVFLRLRRAAAYFTP